MKIMIFDEAQEHRGFNFQEGFAALLDENSGNPAAATSGWECNGMLYVYRPQSDGTWVGRWEDETTFPVEDVLDAMEAWQDNQDLQKALA